MLSPPAKATIEDLLSRSFILFMPKITEETTLAEILKSPENEKILAKHNLPCLTCPFAKYEMENLTLGQVCQTYNIDPKKLLKELNEVCKEKKR